VSDSPSTRGGLETDDFAGPDADHLRCTGSDLGPHLPARAAPTIGIRPGARERRLGVCICQLLERAGCAGLAAWCRFTTVITLGLLRPTPGRS
jgi:hypothetical protein